MSKGNLFLGLATGKIGSVVLYRAFGEERARSWIARKRNPRTWRQALQRVLMKTCQVAYSSLMPVCRETFQGFEVGTPCQSAFVSRNLRILRARIADEIAAGRDAVLESAVGNFCGTSCEVLLANPLMVSDGGLPSLSYQFLGGGLSPVSPPLGSAPTYADVASALGCSKGDRLDVIVAFDASSEPSGRLVDFRLCRIILEPSGGDMSSPFVADGRVGQPNAGNIGDPPVSLSEVGEGEFSLVLFPGRSVVAGAVIRSRMYGELRQYSPQQLLVSESLDGRMPLGSAVASLMGGGSVYLDGGGL